MRCTSHLVRIGVGIDAMFSASHIDSRPRNIWQINVALGRISVPAKHRVNSFLKLDGIRFIDTTGVHPKVL